MSRLVAVASLVVAVIVGASAVDVSAKTSVAAPKVTGVWARTSPVMATMGVAYVTLTSASGDRLVGVKVPARVAATAELHETVAASSSTTTVASDASASTSTSTPTTTRPEAMTMRPVEGIDLPARTPVAMVPGGYHVMLMGLKAPLVPGGMLLLTLRFARSGPVVVRVPVRDRAP